MYMVQYMQHDSVHTCDVHRAQIAPFSSLVFPLQTALLMERISAVST